MFILNMTEFILPNGRKKVMGIEMEDEFKPFYEEMTAKGCEIQLEVLRTGEVSITVSDLKEEFDLDIGIVPNGPEVIEALKRLLKGKSWVNVED